MDDVQNRRMAVIAYLAEKQPRMGRTALMKLWYFMQALKDVALGYNFTLYAYGPFDSDVLADLDFCEAVEAVRSEVVQYPTGHGYEILPGKNPGAAKDLAREFLGKHRTDIDWLVQQFGGLPAGILELLSTIVYTDREAVRDEETLSEVELARRVRDVKPRFPEDQIMKHIARLRVNGLLKSLSS